MQPLFRFLLAIAVSLLFSQQNLAQVSEAEKPLTNTATTQASSGVPDPLPFGEGILPADLKILVDSLTGNTFAGRETGQIGQRLAADYIAAQFKALGLPKVGDKNTYFQNITLQNDTWKDISITVDGTTFQNKTDFFTFSEYTDSSPFTKLKEVVFVGYGIEDSTYNDYHKASVKGKAVVFFDGEPMNEAGKSLVTGKEFRSSWSLDWKKKVRLAKQKGATMVFIVDPKLAENLQKNRKMLSAWGWRPVSYEASLGASAEYVPSLFISNKIFEAFKSNKAEKVNEAIADLRTGKGFKAMALKTRTEVSLEKEIKRLQGSNVLAYIEGSDEKLKGQFVFVTAHYDHLGAVDSTVIYRGADDNASGTSSVIEIARAFAAAKKQGVGPKRTVICMLVSGEEKGLLGSKYYTELPLFPLEKTVVDINIDMVGRVDKAHEGAPNYIYVIGGNRTSNDLHQITEDMNARYTKLELDYKYNAPNEPNNYFGRSDHFNFVMKGVPATFLFNGTHEDYHKPTDTADKINFEAAAKRAQLAFYMAWEIANRQDKISVDFKPETLKK